MASNGCEEVELSKRHEEILGKRAVLLEQMESQFEQHKAKKCQQSALSQAAQQRNAQLLQDLQELETRLSSRKVPHPNVISLETRYWASVEQKLPGWERYLLGKGQPPPSDVRLSPGRQQPRGTLRDPSPTRNLGRPPRPNTRPSV